jgi:hypothetical protein
MAIVRVLSAVSQEVTLNQPYNAATDVDDNDVPTERRLHQRPIDDARSELPDDDRDHIEYVRLLDRLYTSRAMQP